MLSQSPHPHPTPWVHADPRTFSLSDSVLRGLSGQVGCVLHGLCHASSEGSLLHAHALHAPCAVGVLGRSEVSNSVFVPADRREHNLILAQPLGGTVHCGQSQGRLNTEDCVRKNISGETKATSNQGKENFEELVNEEHVREHRGEEVDVVEQDEVKIKSGQAVGHDSIAVEVSRRLGDVTEEFLTV